LITNDAGEPRSILSINIDMTEKKSLERQLIRSQRLEGLGTLAGGIAHDLNNILTPILMSIEGLRKRHSEPKTVRALDTIEAGAQRGADIIKQLLTFARGRKGDFVNIQPRHILKDIERILRSTFPKSIQLRVQVMPGLWSIMGDSTQIHQVLLNLCVNSRDAMEHGGILSLHATNELLTGGETRMNADARPGQYVRMSVGDTGCGIPKENIEKIFDPFFTTKDVGKGTGLGLSTVSTIVKNHGGFIKVYSQPGNGSTFSIYLPAIMDATVAEGRESVSDVARGSGELILVVDDEEFVRDVAQETLAEAGYRVLLASDGVEARKILVDRASDLSLVVTDVMMPNMDGVELVKIVREQHPGLRITAMSGMIASDKLNELSQIGVEHILNKPFTSGDFARFVRTSLGKNARHS
jgi:two-component system cell cycle sensor histidine kinase/response regulator CckA